MRTKLIEVLRKTADKIESGGIEYCWTSPQDCNCGTLLRTISGYEGDSILGPLYANYHPNGYRIGDVRHAIYHRYSALAEKFDVEITRWELVALEQLNDPVVQRRARGWRFWKLFVRHRPRDVVRYMRAWSDLLEEEESEKPLVINPKVEELVAA